MDLYFADAFKVKTTALDRHGAFNISLVADLPLFVDPFLIFNSRRPRYRKLHREIVKYLRFLHSKARTTTLTPGLISSWYRFPEIKENWLGFSKTGNDGRGLGPKFATALHNNLGILFHGLTDVRITKGVHLEKLCLVSDRVGRDNISDFTTNLIHRFLCEYTSEFAKQYIDKSLRCRISVSKVRFNYTTETWQSGIFEVPIWKGEHVLLTPKDLLTKDDTWINKTDLYEDFDRIPDSIANDQLRQQIHNYFTKLLPKPKKKRRIKKEERLRAIVDTLRQFPELIDYYIKNKEERGSEAEKVSDQHVQSSEQLYVRQAAQLVDFLASNTQFYSTEGNAYEAAHRRAVFLKDAIENKGCHRIFYVKGKPIERESDLQILYRLTWYGTAMDVTREANDGRGPADFKISKGARNKSLVEMKLASNSQLERNLKNQAAVYEKASDAKRTVKIILYFSAAERKRVETVLKRLKLDTDDSVVLVDARSDNKASGSKA
jgi:hypothetical protein